MTKTAFFSSSQIKLNFRTFAEKIRPGFLVSLSQESEKDSGLLSIPEDSRTFYFFPLSFDFALFFENGDVMSNNLAVFLSDTGGMRLLCLFIFHCQKESSQVFQCTGISRLESWI